MVFENCDIVTVPGDALYHVNIHTDSTAYNEYVSTAFATSVNLSIDLTKVSQQEANDLTRRKDITGIHVYYLSGADQSFEVPYPMYFNSWLDNPYQDNYYWEDELNDNRPMLDIDIEKYWSILSIKQAVKDYFAFMFRDFPHCFCILFGGYWATFKRHFKRKH